MKLSKEIYQVLNVVEALYFMKKELHPSKKKVVGRPCRRNSILRELSDILGKPYQRIHEWIIERKHVPGLDTFLKIKTWENAKIRSLSASQRKEYAAILKAIEGRR